MGPQQSSHSQGIRLQQKGQFPGRVSHWDPHLQLPCTIPQQKAHTGKSPVLRLLRAWGPQGSPRCLGLRPGISPKGQWSGRQPGMGSPQPEFTC